MADTTVRCVTPDAFTHRVFNPLVRRLTLMGLSVWGSSELRVKGRRSGEWRANVVNPLRFAGTPRHPAASRNGSATYEPLAAATSGLDDVLTRSRRTSCPTPRKSPSSGPT